MTGHNKNILTLLARALLAAALLAPLVIWIMNSAPGFKAHMAKKAAIAPLIKEAEELNITYESARMAPIKTLGKPVVWCIHIASGGAYYGLGAGKPIDIINQPAMPGSLYGRQTGDYECTNALLEITGVKIFKFGQVRSVRTQTRFIACP